MAADQSRLNSEISKLKSENFKLKEEAKKKEDAFWGMDEEMEEMDRPKQGFQKLDEEDLGLLEQLQESVNELQDFCEGLKSQVIESVVN